MNLTQEEAETLRKDERDKEEEEWRKKEEGKEERESNEANGICNGWAYLDCEFSIKTEYWMGDVRIGAWSETEYQQRYRLGNKYKERSETARFSYYAEGFGATRDRYKRPKPARIKKNKLEDGPPFLLVPKSPPFI